MNLAGNERYAFYWLLAQLDSVEGFGAVFDA